MFKKLISYLIIFSIFFPDVARCGTVFGRGSPEYVDDEETPHHLSIKRRSIQDLHLQDPGLGEGTPLISPGQTDLDPTFIPQIPTNFQVVAQSISLDQFHTQGMSLTETEGEPTDGSLVSSMQDTPGPAFAPHVSDGAPAGQSLPFLPEDSNSDSEEDPAFKITFKKSNTEGTDRSTDGRIPPIPNGADSNMGTDLENLSESNEIGPSHFREQKDPDNPDGKEPLVILDLGEGAPQDTGEPRSATKIKRINVYNLQSWKQLTKLQKRALTGGELTAFSGPSPDAIIPYPKQGSLNLQTLDNPEGEDEDIQDFVTVSGDSPSVLSPETEEFLRYVKVRVVDGKFNWKQILGIFGGVLTGAAVAWPWMYIMFDSLLNIYTRNVIAYYYNYGDPIPVDSNVLDTQFQNFNAYLNFKTMMGLVGLPMGIAVASRTAVILSEITEDNGQIFSIQRSKKHTLALRCAKGGLYFGALFAGLLPVYYLYDSLLGCDLRGHLHWNNTDYTKYVYDISNDIFFNISTHTINNTNYDNCTFLPSVSSSPNILLFGITAPFLFFCTILHYGHQLSKPAEKWINNYFFTKADETSFFSPEAIRQGYLTHFKGLKRLIYGLDQDNLDILYATVLAGRVRKIEYNLNADNNHEELTMKEALRVLSIFQEFHHQHKDSLEDEEPEEWQKPCSSNIGWGMSLIATAGRGLVFSYAISRIMFHLSYPSLGGANDHGNHRHFLTNSILSLSFVLGGCIANTIQGIIEKEAVQGGLYNILGGKKIAEGTSHMPLRLGIRVWDTIYGVFKTLPYIVVGMEALLTDFFTENYDYQYNFTFMAWATISLVVSFGITDVFNNVLSFHHSNLGVMNAFDKTFSYCYAFEGYKRDKLIRITRQLRKIFKELSSDVLKVVDQTLNKNHNIDVNPSSKHGRQGKLTEELIFVVGKNNSHKAATKSKNQLIIREQFNEREKSDSNSILSIISRTKELTLSPETQDFLRFVKVRIADGTLSWKQKAGILGGIATGATVAWPLMIIFYDPIFDFYFKRATTLALTPWFNVDFDYFSTLMQTFSKSVNFYTMLGLVGIPLGIDAASRTARILCDLTEEDTQTFSLQKTKKHKSWLILSKVGIYGGAFLAASLPAYYLYTSLTECHSQIQATNVNITGKEFFASYNLFFNNLSYIYFNDTNHNCTALEGGVPLENITMMAVGIPFLMFDTSLQYGHQLSHSAEQWINTYFLRKARKEVAVSPVELKRQEYLAQFRGLKHLIYGLNEDNLDDLYATVLMEGLGKIGQNADINPEELTMKEAFRVLSVFKKFHHQHKDSLEDEDPEEWTKTYSSRIGWGMSLVATASRALVFWYAISNFMLDLCNIFLAEDNNATNSVLGLSFVLGGCIANIIQGAIEKEAAQEGVYNILGGKKIADGTSHKMLRLGIKVWNNIYGVLNTLPYVVLGMEALMTNWWTDNYYYTYRFTFMAWVTFSLIASFSIADAFNNTAAFHESNLGVVNAYDSVRSYWSPTLEYKRDKLIRMTRQLRRLFKGLDDEVLEEVDGLLNWGQGRIQLDNPEPKVS